MFASVADSEVSQLRDKFTLAQWMELHGKDEGWKATPTKKLEMTDWPHKECLSYVKRETLPSGGDLVRGLYFYPPAAPSPAIFPTQSGQELIQGCILGIVRVEAASSSSDFDPELVKERRGAEFGRPFDQAVRERFTKKYGESVGMKGVPFWGPGSRFSEDAGRWIPNAEVVSGYDVQGLDMPDEDALVSAPFAFVHARLPFLRDLEQAQDGSFYGSLSASGGMVKFDKSGNVEWSVPGDAPQIATVDNGVIGASGITYDGNGNVTELLGSTSAAVTTSTTAAVRADVVPNATAGAASDTIGNLASEAESWIGDQYEVLSGAISQLLRPPTGQATPAYSSSAGANPSANNTSPVCRDGRDQIVKQYGEIEVRDVTAKGTPRFTPKCALFAGMDPNSVHSANFNFTMLSTNQAFALIRYPLVAPASAGYGLDKWVELIGLPRTINSGYRTPMHNKAVKGRPGSRHMFGDAADLQNGSCPRIGDPITPACKLEWQRMHDAAGTSTTKAHADYVEPTTLACGYNCTHADWRQQKAKYIF